MQTENSTEINLELVLKHIEEIKKKKGGLNKTKEGSDKGLGFGFEHGEEGQSNVWLTPPNLIESLGDFSLDPASPIFRPWDTAKRHLTVIEDGLKTDWGLGSERVYLNAPYGKLSGPFLNRLVEHGNGVALTFARTETLWLQQCAPYASGFLFLKGRLKFWQIVEEELNEQLELFKEEKNKILIHNISPTKRLVAKERQCATAPSVLISFDNEFSNGQNRNSLLNSNLKGLFFETCLKI